MVWVVLALVFMGLWTYAFYREDHHNPEPFWMIALALGAGCGAYFLAEWIEGRLVTDLDVLDMGSFWDRVRLAFLIAAPVEELAKFLGVLVLIWPWTHFDESMDGIVYGAAAGAGFALLENLAFMQDRPDIILARGPVGTGAHVLFSVLWGGALGFSGHLPRWWDKFRVVGIGLALAIGAHGLFNTITFTAGREITPLQGQALQITLIVACAVFVRWRIRVARQLEPFRFRK